MDLEAASNREGLGKNLGFALGVCSGPKSTVIDFPIFGFESTNPCVVRGRLKSSRVGAAQPLASWRTPLGSSGPLQVVKGCPANPCRTHVCLEAASSREGLSGKPLSNLEAASSREGLSGEPLGLSGEPLSIWRPPQVVKGCPANPWGCPANPCPFGGRLKS